MTQPQDGEWYQASDGNWYCWPNPTPYSAPPTPEPLAPEPLAPEPLAPEPLAPEPLAPQPITPQPITPQPITPQPITPIPPLPAPDVSMPGVLAPRPSPAQSGNRVPAIVAALVALVVVLAAGWYFVLRDDEPTASVRPVATGAPRVDRTTAARALLVTARDLPPGWQGTPHQSALDERAESVRFAQCTGGANPNQATQADLFGDDFSDGAQRQVGSQVVLLRNAQFARQDIASLRNPKFLPCAKASLERILASTVPLPVERLVVTTQPIETYGDAAASLHAEAVIRGPQETVTLYFDVVFMIKGTTEVTVTFASGGAPNDAALVNRVTARVGTALNNLTA